MDPILIVGAGPTGLTAAMELTRQGIPVRLIDKRAGPETTSRAIGVQARTLELFEQRGLADEMVRLGNRSGFGSVYGGGARVFRLDFAHIESHYPYILFLSQAETERILRDHLKKHGVTPEWSTALVAIEQDAHGGESAAAHAVIRNEDGTLAELATPWLIGADGAHSVLRSTLAVPFEGHAREEPYALGDLMMDPALPDTDLHIFSSDHGFMALFPMGGAHFRLIASNPLSTPSADSAPSLDELQRIYDQRSHIPGRMQNLMWSSWFHINSRMVSRLKIGRVLLGGDAAHIHSPAGAQGMNTGIQDMINLCWKLARVVKHQAPLALLDTYETDRLPVMRTVLNRTDKLTTMIGDENAVVRSLFNHVGPFIGGNEMVQENATAGMSQVALNYRDSPLSEQHGHLGSLRAGDRMPELNVRAVHEGETVVARLSTLLDPSCLTVVVASEDGHARFNDEARGEAAMRIIHIEALPDAPSQEQFTRILGRSDTVTLVRPDGYAAMRCPLSEADARLSAYTRTWLTIH